MNWSAVKAAAQTGLVLCRAVLVEGVPCDDWAIKIACVMEKRLSGATIGPFRRS